MKTDPRFPNLFVVDHPLVQHKLSIMRREDSSTAAFHALLDEITLLMGYELTRDLPLEPVKITTPVAEATVMTAAGKKPVIVPVLRAGLGMSQGLLELMPSARIGHIGLYRNEKHEPVEYLVKLPSIEGRLFIVCDPMIATGHSAVHAVDVLKKRGVAGKNIRFLALVTAPEGIEEMLRHHPDVKIWAAALDDCLNDKAYIVPGLGDAGDRLFGTD